MHEARPTGSRRAHEGVLRLLDRRAAPGTTATSALDSEVQAAIRDTLYRVMQGKTVIAIAHRLSTIARMDRIIIVGEGAHAQLVARGGQLWNRQSGGFLEAAE